MIQVTYPHTEWNSAPIDASQIIGGDPATRNILLTAHGSLTSGFWTCAPSRFIWDYANCDEVIHVLAGSALIRDVDTNTWNRIEKGTTVLFVRGSKVEWIVEQQITKFWTIREDRPSLVRRVVRKLARLI